MDLTAEPILHEVIELKHDERVNTNLRDVVCLNIGGTNSIVVFCVDCTAGEDVMDLTAEPILHEVIELKHDERVNTNLRDVVCLNIGGTNSIVVFCVDCTAGEDVMDLTAEPILHEVIELKHDERVNTNLRDVVCLNIGGTNCIVVTDYCNSTVQSVYMKNGRRSSSQLKVIHYPWSLSVLHESMVVVSVPHKNQILTVGVNPDLELISTVTTTKQYFGLAVLDNSTLVAGSVDFSPVDVLDLSGNVLRSFTTLTTIQEYIRDPCYLHVTNQGNILVSDLTLKSVTSLTPTGEVEFHYSPRGERELKYPRGISATPRGDILFVDCHNHKVIHLTQSGEFVKDILTSQDGLDYPVGICVDGDKLYVATITKGVHVFKFPHTQ